MARKPAPVTSLLADVDTSTFQTLRRQAMQSLFDSLDRQCEGTVVVDKEARIVWINDRYAHRFGLTSAAQAIGREIEEVIPNSLMRQVVQTGEPILLDLLEADKQFFIVTRVPLKDEQGHTIGAVGFALYDQLQPLSPLFAKFLKMQDELARTRKSLQEARRTRYNLSNLIGISPANVELKRQALRAARLDSPVLLLGETGTGKELLAQAIHAASARAHRPFIGVNVAAIPENLLEAEFFGVAPGAYTGAERKGREGKFALAQGGTLFLDEIGDMPIGLQAKLLRVLQEQEFEPLGSNRVIKTDVRIIAATSRHLIELVTANQFRPDLFYRLNVLSIRLPPLRDRLEDLPVLCEHILSQLALNTGLLQRDLDAAALALLRAHQWPGNIRELRNVLEKTVMVADHPHLGAADLVEAAPELAPLKVSKLAPIALADVAPIATVASAFVPMAHAQAMADFERDFIRQTLAACDGKVGEAAKRLELGRATLYKKMAALGLSSKEGEDQA